MSETDKIIERYELEPIITQLTPEQHDHANQLLTEFKIFAKRPLSIEVQALLVFLSNKLELTHDNSQHN